MEKINVYILIVNIFCLKIFVLEKKLTYILKCKIPKIQSILIDTFVKNIGLHVALRDM